MKLLSSAAPRQQVSVSMFARYRRGGCKELYHPYMRDKPETVNSFEPQLSTFSQRPGKGRPGTKWL